MDKENDISGSLDCVFKVPMDPNSLDGLKSQEQFFLFLLLKKFSPFQNTCMYRVILKKVSFGIFSTILVLKKEKNYYKKQRQRAISEPVNMIFGHSQNHQN